MTEQQGKFQVHSDNHTTDEYLVDVKVFVNVIKNYVDKRVQNIIIFALKLKILVIILTVQKKTYLLALLKYSVMAKQEVNVMAFVETPRPKVSTKNLLSIDLVMNLLILLHMPIFLW